MCNNSVHDGLITKDILTSAEKIAGLSFTDKERNQMLKGLNNSRSNYLQLRKTKMDHGISPVLYFNPQLPDIDYSQIQKPIKITNYSDIEIPTNFEDIAYFSLPQLAHLLRNRKISSVELTKLYFRRLKRYNPKLECVITFTEDIALKQAKQADSEIGQGQYRGPLHGIPYGIKDLFAYPGLPTTWGAKPYKDQIINEKATVIQRLEDAGAVMIAKLAMGELGDDNVWFGGKTKSPWNLEKGAGGSSSGSAAATAAGLVGFSIGSETWGSIIHPSDRCGTTGLRPTYGRVSRFGAMTLSWSMDKLGPICRTVEGCAIVFDAIYGPDSKDLTIRDIPFNWDSSQGIDKIRVGYTKTLFEQERPYKEHDDQTLKVLESMGLKLIPIELPDISINTLYIIILAEAATVFEELILSDQDDLLETELSNSFRMARLVPAVEYLKANRLRRIIMEEMAELFTQVDVFLTPTIDHTQNFWTTTSNFLSNLTGHPAVVVPNGFKNDNMPTSITFIGDLYKETETLYVAKAYQDATDFHLRYPNLSINQP